MVKPLELRPHVTVDNQPASGRTWPVDSWARYIQSRPPLVGTIDLGRAFTLLSVETCTHAPRRVGPNCVLGSSTTANGPRTRLFVDHWDSRARQQKHGRFGHYLGREPSGTWSFCVPLNWGHFITKFLG